MHITTVELSKKSYKEVPYGDIDIGVSWLILSDNKIRQIDDKISKFKKLTRLALNDNKIEELSSKIGECKELAWMDLTRNKLSDLPVEFGNLTKISGLGLSENNFTEIPEAVYKLVNLRKFGFFSNKITHLSSSIINLKKLVKIDLSNNNIIEVPNELMHLTELEWLNLSNNKIKKIPSGINNLVKLGELGLGMNEIEEIPCIDKLNNLRIFPCFKNKLTKVHSSVFKLRKIEKLDFSDNNLTDFPYEALYSDTLKYLNIRSNNISNISSTPINPNIISRINMLDLSDNNLKYIPYKLFRSLKQSASVRLMNNPYEIQLCKSPTTVSLREICITYMIRNNKDLQCIPWLSTLFKKKQVCDKCNKWFVNDPYKAYSGCCFDDDNKFIVEKVTCSSECMNKSRI